MVVMDTNTNYKILLEPFQTTAKQLHMCMWVVCHTQVRVGQQFKITRNGGLVS